MPPRLQDADLTRHSPRHEAIHGLRVVARPAAIAFFACLAASCANDAGRRPHESAAASSTPASSTALDRAVAASPREVDTARPSFDAGIPDAAAFEIVDLPSGHVVRAQRWEYLGRATLPGSLNKVITLLAARRAGLVVAGTRIACSRGLRVEGRLLDCVHPVSAAGLTAVESLAHSCNTFFVAVSRQLSREQWSAAAVSLGLPPIQGNASMPLTAVGLAGPHVEPRLWVRALERAAGADPVVREGLEKAALEELRRTPKARKRP